MIVKKKKDLFLNLLVSCVKILLCGVKIISLFPYSNIFLMKTLDICFYKEDTILHLSEKAK